MSLYSCGIYMISVAQSGTTKYERKSIGQPKWDLLAYPMPMADIF